MLSIIIPTLNEEKYLPLLLESIRKQDFSDKEIIVADAGSTDATLQIARDYGCTIVEGGLPAKARNNGARIAKGDILLFLDSDVILSPDFLKNAVHIFTKKNLGIAGFLIVPLRGKIMDVMSYAIFDLFVKFSLGLFAHAGMAIMASKKVHQTIGGFDENVRLMEDMVYAKKAKKVSKYAYIRQPVQVSMRRYEKDGRLATYSTYVLAGMAVGLGRLDWLKKFTYTFGNYKKDE